VLFFIRTYVLGVIFLDERRLLGGDDGLVGRPHWLKSGNSWVTPVLTFSGSENPHYPSDYFPFDIQNVKIDHENEVR
jgi:hypothetical protein